MVYPLISVIIPCYNHGRYLHESITSVLSQNYSAVEIVVVDDGSTDTTREIAEQYNTVKYIYQDNQGLSAARNKGIRYSSGQYLVFLDADDWLLPKALERNAYYLRQNPELAFVSGGHDKVYVDRNYTKHHTQEVAVNHYCQLLERNYISMIASVMYQRWAFDEFNYDPTLKACEDYDLYLRIARMYPVAHHTHRIAAYRIHSNNMSLDIPLMLSTALKALKGQQQHLRNDAEKQAYAKGQEYWKEYYGMELYMKITLAQSWPTRIELATLLSTNPLLVVRYFLQPLTSALKRLLRK
jgi:glycosyltransferase involved in cell wall biosynthesis